MKYTDKQIKLLIEGIYDGRFNASYELPEDLYFAIADYLKEALYNGYGGALEDFEFGGTDYELISSLRENVYMFSGAKTYQQVSEMGGFVAESKTFREFRNLVMPVYERYNQDWLNAEYNTAVGQAQQANQWQRFEDDKDQFPYLRYIAVMDANTSDICRPLNDIVRPVDDSLWAQYSPLNHFNCRCTLEKLSKYDDVKQSSAREVKRVTKELDETVSDTFKMNPGKDGYIFSPKHPYFDVAPKDKGFAKRNFDLPIPEKD
jgi:SPP1 gp7 family putative phage head morphogenesis protein